SWAPGAPWPFPSLGFGEGGGRCGPASSLLCLGPWGALLFIGFLSGIDYKTTTILLDGRRVKLELWDTSGQGRFCTIFRSYSRGAQGILLVYDITNRWSFDGIDRWIKEIDEHAPGVPRILVGNRLHLAFKRQVPTEQARAYAEKNCMTFFEVSPLCNFNVIESFTELSRIVLMRHGMEKIWRPNRAALLVTYLHMDPQLLLTRKGKPCLPASPSHQIVCLGSSPGPDCRAPVSSSQRDGERDLAALADIS
uniref:small monomeric GTPase n=1 Tax=Athene cunicularia TaxID=194338 RepID=A0A663LRN1_ATHCN